METLELLGMALGLATLAGLNLYLTVFVTGLAVRMDWISLAEKYSQLEILADPAVLWVSGVLFFLEFFADKVPWVDSLWDSVHTVIRPVGGALVAITVLGEANPAFDVIVGLLGGGMALTSHAAKSGTRLIANASPEPFSNIALSLGEDVVVLAGLGLIATNPVVALVVAVLAFAMMCWLLPKVFRLARTTFWFIWKRVSFALGGTGVDPAAKVEVPGELAAEIRRMVGRDVAIDWAAPAVSGKGTELKGNTFGWLLFSAEDGGMVYFARAGRPRPTVTALEVAAGGWTFDRGVIKDRLVLRDKERASAQTVLFDRSRRVLVEDLVRRMEATGRPRVVESPVTVGR